MTTLDQIKQILNEYFVSKPVQKAWVFGSYARGEQTEASDIDILVSFDEDNYPSLLSHVEMILALQNLLDTKIDIVPNDCVHNYVRHEIDKDKILLYERV